MTRFEEAAQSPMNMSIMVAFCIAAYLEGTKVKFFTDEELKEFMRVTHEDIQKWLEEEREGGE